MKEQEGRRREEKLQNDTIKLAGILNSNSLIKQLNSSWEVSHVTSHTTPPCYASHTTPPAMRHIPLSSPYLTPLSSSVPA